MTPTGLVYSAPKVLLTFLKIYIRIIGNLGILNLFIKNVHMAGEYLGEKHHRFLDNGQCIEYARTIRGGVEQLVAVQREHKPKEGSIIDDSPALMPVNFEIKGEFEWRGKTVVVLQCKNGFAELVNIGLGLLELEPVSAEELREIIQSRLPEVTEIIKDIGSSLAATAPNDDKKILIMDTNPDFPDYNFSIGEQQIINPNVALIAFRKKEE
jgi:hypothetical protein